MIKEGIYTLANDIVYDQLVALLNSIEVNISPNIPVCIIPFDERLDKVKQEVKSRDNVYLFENWESIKRWELFVTEVWRSHPEAQKKSIINAPWGKGHHHKFVAFDGDFDKFVFYDADSLAMKPLDKIFAKLDDYDFVFDDWEHRKPTPTAALNISLIVASGCYQESQIRPLLHCSSFFASKKGIFNPQELVQLKEKLVHHQEAGWISRWWDDAFLFNYLTLRSDRTIYNLTLSDKGEDKTGNCADADSFVNINNILYNEQGLKPIHRIHYMNYSSLDFTRLTKGEDVNIRYQDIFLHYRFLKNPQQQPKVLKPPSLLTKLGKKWQQIRQKLTKIIKH